MVTRFSISFTLGCFLALTLSACTSNRLTALSTASSTNSSDPLAGVIINVDEADFALTRVVKSALTPSASFDLIGDGSGAFGAKCTATDGGPGQDGKSTCSCSFSYALPDGSTQNFEAETSYHEADLIRCLTAGIPAAVTSVSVRVHVIGTSAFSNPFTFKFLGTGVSLDPSSASTFAAVQRYQCRDSVWISNSFDSSIYDPFQSEDLHNSYPLNFYTTNLGGALAIYAGGMSGVSPPYGFQCPALPNDPAAKMDLAIYSIGADSAGSKRIYPPAGSAFDRSTFYVAKQATGVFSVPIDTLIAPDIHTSPPDSQGNQSGVPPIGYGAAPIPNGKAGQETCPDSSVSIPDGYHWVKVWLFRMALNVRKGLQSSYFGGLGEIACSPGDWLRPESFQHDNNGNVIASVYNSVFPDCFNNTNSNPAAARYSDSLYLAQLFDNSTTPATRLHDLASRYFVNQGACFNLDPSYHPLSGLTGNGPGLASAVAQYSSLGLGSGTDIWFPNQRYPGAHTVEPNYGCGGPNNTNPAHLCTPPTPPGNRPYGYDTQLSTIDIDDPSNPRYDFVFVVSPATVMSGDMTNPSSTVHNIYTPFRFMSLGDCNSPDPDNPSTAGDCLAERALRNYGIKFHDVSSAGDPPAADPNRSGVFPVCALQPN